MLPAQQQLVALVLAQLLLLAWQVLLLLVWQVLLLLLQQQQPPLRVLLQPACYVLPLACVWLLNRQHLSCCWACCHWLMSLMCCSCGLQCCWSCC